MFTDLNFIEPIDTSNPINRRHPLCRGLTAFFLPTQNLFGGNTFWDLCNLTPTKLNSFTGASAGWRRVGYPGHKVALLSDATAFCQTGPTPGVNLTGEMSAMTIFNQSAFNAVYNFIAGDTGQSTWTMGTNNGVSTTNQLIEWAGVNIMAGSATLQLNTWYQQTFTRYHTLGSTNFNGELYLNGQLDGSVTNTNNVPLSMSNFAISKINGVSRSTTGYIAVVIVWNRRLLPQEVLALYNESRAGYPNMLNRVAILNKKIYNYFTCSVGLPNLPFAVRVG